MAKKQENQENYLDYIPVISELNSWDVNEDGRVTVHITRKGAMAWVAQRLFAAPRVTNIKLDELGSFVFQSIDGQRTVGEVAKLVEAEFGEKAEPLYDRLVEYMQTLHNHQFIYFAGKDEPPQA